MMGIRAVRASTTLGDPPMDRDASRLLALLRGNRAEPLTIAAMHERGIEAPAQAIYTLQLTGYQIDRVPVQRPDGRITSGYRLSQPSGGSTPEEPANAD
jgi:hypothetical protein